MGDQNLNSVPSTVGNPSVFGYDNKGSHFRSFESRGYSTLDLSSSNSPIPEQRAVPSDTSNAVLSQSQTSWLGSVEGHEGSVVQISRVVLVDCLMYPFRVFSRQCQFFPYNQPTVSVAAPFSTIVVLNNIMHSQGVGALWRGWRSHTLLLLVQPCLEGLLFKLLGRPGYGFSLRNRMKELLIRSLPHLATMPLLSYVYLEMVQTTHSKETMGIGDAFHPIFKMDEFRRIPFLYLAGPTVLHGLVSHLLAYLIHRFAQRLFPARVIQSELRPLFSVVRELWFDYFSLFMTETLLYPLETVLVRLFCQGMPALADNIQTGMGTHFVESYHSGMMNCVNGILESEGPLGFFKGFSSVLIRYSIHGALLMLLWRTVCALDSANSKR